MLHVVMQIMVKLILQLQIDASVMICELEILNHVKYFSLQEWNNSYRLLTGAL
jgi:hypothetical protein